MKLLGPRRILAHLAYATGTWRALPFGPVILFYHGIVERARDPLLESDSLPIDAFREQLDFFRKHRSVISLGQLIDDMAAHRTVDPATIVLTFDDALSSVADYAVPELTRRSMPFTVGVPTGLPGTGRSIWEYEAACLVHVANLRGTTSVLDRGVRDEMHRAGCEAPGDRSLLVRLKHLLRIGVSSDERLSVLDRLIEASAPDLREWIAADGRLRIMDWEQLRGMAAAGGALAAHGYLHHPHNHTLSVNDRDRELRLPVTDIREKTGASCDCFIWPEGVVDSSSAARALEIGYRGLLTSRTAVVDHRASAHDLPRVSGQWPLPQLLWNAGQLG